MTLSSREKLLAGLAAGAFFLLLTLAFLSAFSKKRSLLSSQLSNRRTELAAIQTLLGERELWEKRDAWLNEKQPKLLNESSAGVSLLDDIRELARSQTVTLENPVIGQPGKTQWYRSVTVNVETRSTWDSLIAFLQAAQKPDGFIIFENANLQIDAADASLMRGRFKIARWYAP